MTRKEVFNGVQDIFRDIFDEDELIISDTTSSDEIEDWDSLSHINLVIVIEKEFKIKFTLQEFMILKDIGSMVNLIVEKLTP